MKKLIIPHRIASYRCPVNGLCDIYEWKTGTRIPEALIFDSRVGFKMFRNEQEQFKTVLPPVSVFFGEGGAGKTEYRFWQDKIGYQVCLSEGKPFEEALQDARALIDQDIPVILFGLDMYHLPYQSKFYHRFHVPGHVNLMVGYDGNTIFVHDNDREGVQPTDAGDLELAWADGYMDLSRRNTLFGIDMDSPNLSLEEILRKGFSQTADAFLNAPAENLGLRGYRLLADEISFWPEKYNKGELRLICEHLVTFTGSTIPELPRQLRPYDTGVINPHRGCRDVFAEALRTYSKTLGGPEWEKAAHCFERSGKRIEKLTDCIAGCVDSEDYSRLKRTAAILEELMESDLLGFQLLSGL